VNGGLLPLTYDESRARFRRAATVVGAEVRAHPIPARGPFGQELTVDVVHLGAAKPRRALTVLSGVHGVEGFVCSAVQTALLGRLRPEDLPDDVAVVLVHAVNPWGMAWGRRQNEANVDLNRNWRRSEVEPVHNDPYDEVHALACPDGPELPSIDALLIDALALVEQHGLDWVRDAITVGQYRHPDGLHYGGHETEASNRILERVVAEHLVGVERSFALDLHTGHGPRAAVTLLSDEAPGSPQDAFLRRAFGDEVVMATVGNDEATTGTKSGQIGSGMGDLLDGAVHHATSAEFGTTSDEEQIAATYQESWVHRHGDLAVPAHAAAAWAYRCCFTPEDPAWEQACLAAGAHLVDDAVAAVASWED
jgi:hypothetical protein